MDRRHTHRDCFVRTALLASVFALALWARLAQLGATSALQDSIGPYLAAARMDGRAHADPYGMLLLIPYWVSNHAGSLWNATAAILGFHALIAPVGAWLVMSLRPTSRLLPMMIGFALAIDPGLLDTAKSGAEGYFAALFVGLMVVCRGSWAWIALAVAVANHPLALCGAPLILIRRENVSYAASKGMILAAVPIVHQGLGWGDPGVGSTGSAFLGAAEAFFRQSGGLALVIAAGPFVGLAWPRTRKLAQCTLAAVAILGLAGELSGYLRDHHLRILSVPAVACWAGVAAWRAGLIGTAAMVFAPEGPVPNVAQQPGTVSLASIVSRTVASLEGPLHMERVWFDGGPAVEPAAIMLDSFQRDREATQYQADGRLILVVAGLESTMEAVGAPGRVLLEGPTFVVTATDSDEARSWLIAHCHRRPKIGGSWDGYSALRPNTRLEDLEVKWGCP